MWGGLAGTNCKVGASRSRAFRKARNCCQLPTACSTGASARDMMIAAAIIVPAVDLVTDGKVRAKRQHAGLNHQAQNA